MADSSNKIDVLLNAVLNAKGFEELQGKLRDVASAQNEGKESANEFKEAVTGLAEAYLGFEAAKAILEQLAEFMKESFLAAVESEKEFTALANTLQMLTGATAAESKAASEWIENLEKASGKSKGELIPALDQLVARTGSLAASQDMLSIATGSATRNVGESVEGNVTVLMRYIETGKVSARATSVFASELRNAAKGGGDMGDVLARMPSQWRDAGAAVDTANQQIERNKVAWENTKEAIGGLVLSLVSVLAPALHLASEFLVNMVSGAVIGFAGLRLEMQQVGDAAIFLKEMLTIGYKAAEANLRASGKAQAKAFDDVRLAAGEASEKVEAAWAHLEAAIGSSSAQIKAHAKGVKTGHEDMAKSAMKALDDEMKNADAEMASVKKVAEEYKKAEEAKKKAIAEFAIAEKKAIADADKLRLMQIKAEAKNKKDELTHEAEFWRTKVATAKAGTLEYYEAEKELHDKEEQLRVMRNEGEKKQNESTMQTAAMGLEAMKAVAGKHKAMAIAETIVNTGKAVVGALANPPEPPYSIPQALAAGAMGAAQIASIEGVGFDDPRHDAMAYMGGQRWARDMVGEFTQGVTKGWASGMAGGGGVQNNSHTTTNNYNTNKTSQFNIHGVGLMDTGNDKQMRGFVQKLQLYSNQLEANRTLK